MTAPEIGARPTSAAAILDDILAFAGQPAAGDAVTFHGADPVFPTTFRMSEFGAATIAAAALQAARVHEARTGLHQTVAVELDAAAAAMRSWRYLHEVPRPAAAPGRYPVAFYETADGRWVFLHRMLDHHFERQLAVLGCGPDDASLAAAIRRWTAADLEAAIMAAGACAAVVRTHAEWAAHDQGKAVARLPLFRITKIGESDPIPVGTGDRPLGGVRVLDLTRVLAGPTTSRTLAEHGADVLRVCSPVYPDGGPMPRDTGHGKRSTVLDLRDAEQAAALRRLIGGADVFSQGYRPGALARLGFSPEEVAAARPGIISVAISAFGADGPWRDARGYDSVVQAASGVAHEVGAASGTPRSMPANPLDYTSGYLAAFLVQVALQRRAREGGSYHIELSLAQTGRYLDDLARIDPHEAAARPDDLDATRMDELMMERDTPYGRLRYLRPTAQLSHTPAHWATPSVPADHDRAAW